MWGSSSTSSLPHLVFQFQSTYLISVQVYFVQCSSSSLLHPWTSPVWGFFQSSLYTCKQCSFTWTGSFSWAPLTHLHCMWDFSSAKTHLHSLLILMAVTSLKCIGFFLCVYFLLNISLKCCSCILNCIFNMYFELYFQYNNKLVSVFKELLVIIRFLNEN